MFLGQANNHFNSSHFFLLWRNYRTWSGLHFRKMKQWPASTGPGAVCRGARGRPPRGSGGAVRTALGHRRRRRRRRGEFAAGAFFLSTCLFGKSQCWFIFVMVVNILTIFVNIRCCIPTYRAIVPCYCPFCADCLSKHVLTGVGMAITTIDRVMKSLLNTLIGI